MMSNPSTNTLAAVQAIVAEELDIVVAELQPARPLEELGVDSLGIIEVMFKLEETFDVRMGDERVPIKTVQDIANIVDKLIRERDAGAKGN
jgi:acyl carrier protein